MRVTMSRVLTTTSSPKGKTMRLVVILGFVCLLLSSGGCMDRSLATSWKGHADTDLDFNEFMGGDHTVSLRFMPEYLFADWAPILGENGTGYFALGQVSRVDTVDGKNVGVSQIWLKIADKQRKWEVPVEPGKWHSLALVGKRGNWNTDFTVYLDGEKLSPQLSVSNNHWDWPKGTIRIGRRTDGEPTGGRPNAQFYGLTDDVAIFSRALGAAEVAEISKKNHKFDGSETDLVAAYTFDTDVSATRLKRGVSFTGAARSVLTSKNRSELDSATFILPSPENQETLLLPFAPGQAWTVSQGYSGQFYAEPSHGGIYDGCMDFIAADKANSYLEPIFAAASGTVEVGDYQTRHIRKLPHGSHMNTYMHMEPANTPEAFAWPSVGQWFLRGERVGVLTNYSNGAHLHFCNRERDPDGIEKDKFFMAAFSNYEVKRKDGTWRFVKRGIPGRPGLNDAVGKKGAQIVRRPLPANLPEQVTAIWRSGTESERQIFGATYDEYRELYEKLSDEGWRLKDLEVAVVNQAPRYAAVWSQQGSITEEVFDEIGASDLHVTYLSQRSLGRRLHILAPYVVNGELAYTAVFRNSDANEETSPFNGYDFDTYQAKYDELWLEGYRLEILEVFVRDGEPLYMATWRKHRGNLGEVQHYGLDRNELLAKYDELWRVNWRLEMIETYSLDGTTYYAAIWRPGRAGEYQIFDAPYRDYQNFYDNLWPDGWRLHAIDVR